MSSRRLAVVVSLVLLWTGVVSNAALAADNDSPYHVGETSRLFHPEVARNWRGAATEGLVTQIWYPVYRGIPESRRDIGLADRQFFRAHPAADDAPLSASHAKYPLLLLSHGTGGSAGSLDWLASALAANGYIVAAVNHPGNNALEPLTQDGFMLWWERATDVSEVLDGVLADPVLGAHIDRDRIGAVGFSLGGYTILELAGARTNLPAFRNFCSSPVADATCSPPERKRLNDDHVPVSFTPEATASMARAGASYRDERIKAVVAIAPALGEAFDNASFANVDIPVLLLGGTADVTVPVQTNIHRIAGLMPNAQVIMVPGASHYTFVDTCLPAMAKRFANLCEDGPGVDRDAVHALAIERSLHFFMTTLLARSS
ncbi:alpha/beta hydrolase family protein [Paraburkholderia megapolitana]|uniref:alpha/beta hydrolase family protein n=1 Tax=Paraburkholderia megapolitana TaxID=420953 RepID=UPI0038BD6981